MQVLSVVITERFAAFAVLENGTIGERISPLGLDLCPVFFRRTDDETYLSDEEVFLEYKLGLRDEVIFGKLFQNINDNTAAEGIAFHKLLIPMLNDLKSKTDVRDTVLSINTENGIVRDRIQGLFEEFGFSVKENTSLAKAYLRGRYNDENKRILIEAFNVEEVNLHLFEGKEKIGYGSLRFDFTRSALQMLESRTEGGYINDGQKRQFIKEFKEVFWHGAMVAGLDRIDIQESLLDTEAFEYERKRLTASHSGVQLILSGDEFGDKLSHLRTILGQKFSVNQEDTEETLRWVFKGSTESLFTETAPPPNQPESPPDNSSTGITIPFENDIRNEMVAGIIEDEKLTEIGNRHNSLTSDQKNQTLSEISPEILPKSEFESLAYQNSFYDKDLDEFTEKQGWQRTDLDNFMSVRYSGYDVLLVPLRDIHEDLKREAGDSQQVSKTALTQIAEKYETEESFINEQLESLGFSIDSGKKSRIPLYAFLAVLLVAALGLGVWKGYPLLVSEESPDKPNRNPGKEKDFADNNTPISREQLFGRQFQGQIWTDKVPEGETRLGRLKVYNARELDLVYSRFSARHQITEIDLSEKKIYTNELPPISFKRENGKIVIFCDEEKLKFEMK